MSEKSIGSESNAGSENSHKSYAQVVGVPEKRFPNFGSYGSPLHLQTQLSSSSGGATTPISISSSSSCHDLFKPDGIPILNSSEIKRRLKKVSDILYAKRGDADHYENKATEWKTQLKLEPNADQKLTEYQKELNKAVDKIKHLNDQKKRAQSDVTDVVNRLTDWQNRNPDCRTGHKLEHLENKSVKLQKDIDIIKDKLEKFNLEYDNIGRKLKEIQKGSLATQEQRLVSNIRICKEKLSALGKKKEELSGFAKKLKDLSETISKFDNQIKEWQPKVDELTKKSTPLKNAIDTRDRLDKLKGDIKRYEEELSSLNERNDHLKEQRKLKRLSLQSSNQGATNKYHFTSGNKTSGHSHTKDLINNAHMLLTALRGLPSDQTKRKVVHPDVLKLLHEFDLSAKFMEDGGLETCINFLEKYVNQPPLRLPAPVAGTSSMTPTGTLVGSRTEDSDSVFAESGYNSVSWEKQANQQPPNGNGHTHDEVSSNQNTAASSIVQLEALGAGFESSSHVPRTSIAEEEEEEEEEEPLKETFSQTLFRRQQSAESSLRQIPSHSATRSLYVSEWMATKTEGRDDPRSFTHTSSAVDINLEDTTEYPPLNTAVQLMQINPELADSDEKLESADAAIMTNK